MAEKDVRSWGKAIDLLVAFVLIMFIPLVSTYLTDLIYPVFSSLDPDGTFLWISVHHVLQVSLALAAMAVLGPVDRR